MRRLLSIAATVLAVVSIATSALAETPKADDDSHPAAAAADGKEKGKDKDHKDPKEPAKDDKKDGAKEHKEAKDDDDPDPNDHHPIKYEVGINVQKIHKFELGPGTFEAEFLVTYHCATAPCKPHMTLFNGEIKGKPDSVVDEPLHKVYRVKAELATDIDISEFPFDQHELEIDLGDHDEDAVFVANAKDAPNPADDVKIPGWNVIGGEAKITIEKLDDGINVSHYNYSVDVKRPSVAAVAKNFLPALTMVLVLFVSLFMKPKMAPARLTAGTGSFVAVIMFHNTASAQLPPLSFFTRLDKFMFTLYLLWLVHIAFSVAILRADEQKNDELGAKLYKFAWIVCPILVAIEWALVFGKVV